MSNENASKLSGDHKAILIQLLADFWNNDEILKHFKQEFSIEMSSANISFYRKNHEADIIQQRESLNERLLAIPIANKFYRLEKRQELLDDIMEHLWCETVKLKRNNQIGYNEDGNPVMVKLKGNHSAANQIMDSVFKEQEPSKFALTDPTGKNEYKGVIVLPPLDSGNGDGDNDEKSTK